MYTHAMPSTGNRASARAGDQQPESLEWRAAAGETRELELEMSFGCGSLTAAQFRALADLAEDHAAGYARLAAEGSVVLGQVRGERFDAVVKGLQRLGIGVRARSLREAGGNASGEPHHYVMNVGQPGVFCVGVVIPSGSVAADQMRGLSDIADHYGSGVLQMTPQIGLLVPDIAEVDLELVQRELSALGLTSDPA